MSGTSPQSLARVAEAAVAQVGAWLGPRGQWPGEVLAPDGSVQRDMSPPLTALGALALLGSSVPGAAEVVERSRVHVALTVQPGGWWRYYANIPPDTDDTAMCVMALGRDHPVVRETGSVDSLLSVRRPDGLFPTWFEPGWSPVVEPVPNAHVVAGVGPVPETAAAVGWLLDVVAAGDEAARATYYPDPLDLHVAVTRAVAAGVSELAVALPLAAGRAHRRLADAGPDESAYRTAQAIVVAAQGPEPDHDLLQEAADRLLLGRSGLAAWPADTLYVAGRTGGGLMHYRSAAVVTALSARALWLAAATAGE